MKKSNLYFVFTTRYNVSSTLILELLEKIATVMRDYIGMESEESYRKNFILIYEILDEIVDFGNVQQTSGLKYYIINEPIEEIIPTESVLTNLVIFYFFNLKVLKPKTKSSLSVRKSVHSKKQTNNEVFVDVVETINCVLSATGSVIRAEICGQIIMKSFLLGQPSLSLALNENLVIGKSSQFQNGTCILDGCSFSEICQLNEFDQTRTINLSPQEGEFTIMNYRINTPYNMPFRIFPTVQLTSKFKLEGVVKVKGMYPTENQGAGITIKIPLPKQTNSVNVELEKEKGKITTYEYNTKDKYILWDIGNMIGGIEFTLKFSCSLSETILGDVKKHVGPITMNFEVPSINTSDLRIRYLKVRERSKTYNPQSWIRYITSSGSYICRM